MGMFFFCILAVRCADDLNGGSMRDLWLPACNRIAAARRRPICTSRLNCPWRKCLLASGRVRGGTGDVVVVFLQETLSGFHLLENICYFPFLVLKVNLSLLHMFARQLKQMEGWWFGLVKWGFEPLVLVESKWEIPLEPPSHQSKPPLQGKRIVQCQFSEFRSWLSGFKRLPNLKVVI